MARAQRDTRTLVEQLRDDIIALISDEQLKPGDQLPTEQTLTETFGVSRPALREALKLLEQDAVIRVERGKGRFITAGATVRVERPITVFESVTQMVRRYGYEPSTRVLSTAEVPADEEVAEALRCPVGEPLVRLERLRLNRDVAILYCVDFVRRSLVPGRLYDTDWSGSLVELMGSRGARPVMSTAHASAVLLPEDVAARNDLRDFGPALLITETCFSADGEPVIYALDYHRGDAFSFSFVRK
ncbi:GntR family transcriptional regulator [Chthonobacter rhizosphaerae]|uniref:GntR family transcriptional regulator n=1 Tax=Chthonobacter rhizosphaerae TaxID=2735553 RepID=UPI0015EE4F95|nr:GntR family transcriptional regulator [Chthonobacter rhizosphaerae]